MAETNQTVTPSYLSGSHKRWLIPGLIALAAVALGLSIYFGLSNGQPNQANGLPVSLVNSAKFKIYAPSTSNTTSYSVDSASAQLQDSTLFFNVKDASGHVVSLRESPAQSSTFPPGLNNGDRFSTNYGQALIVQHGNASQGTIITNDSTQIVISSSTASENDVHQIVVNLTKIN